MLNKMGGASTLPGHLECTWQVANLDLDSLPRQQLRTFHKRKLTLRDNKVFLHLPEQIVGNILGGVSFDHCSLYHIICFPDWTG